MISLYVYPANSSWILFFDLAAFLYHRYVPSGHQEETVNLHGEHYHESEKAALPVHRDSSLFNNNSSDHLQRPDRKGSVSSSPVGVMWVLCVFMLTCVSAVHVCQTSLSCGFYASTNLPLFETVGKSHFHLHLPPSCTLLQDKTFHAAQLPCPTPSAVKDVQMHCSACGHTGQSRSLSVGSRSDSYDVYGSAWVMGGQLHNFKASQRLSSWPKKTLIEKDADWTWIILYNFDTTYCNYYD